jgi:hypothetical protein
MHQSHSVFISALHARMKVILTFHSQEDRSSLIRTCAPMDFGPSRRVKDSMDRYHFWDFDSDKKSHTLSLKVEQIIVLELHAESFDPAEFITWDVGKFPWFVARDWQRFS